MRLMPKKKKKKYHEINEWVIVFILAITVKGGAQLVV